MEQHDNEQKNFGENVYLLRKAHRLSQKEMAQIMGVSLYCQRKAEQGIFTNSLYMDALEKLCRYFSLRPADLFMPKEMWSMELLMHGRKKK